MRCTQTVQDAQVELHRQSYVQLASTSFSQSYAAFKATMQDISILNACTAILKLCPRPQTLLLHLLSMYHSACQSQDRSSIIAIPLTIDHNGSMEVVTEPWST
jgi:hypothetical protein